MMDLDTDEGMDNAKAWLQDLIGMVQEGGKWIVPRSMSIYTIHHVTKVATRYGLLPDPAVDRVFREIGWTVFDINQS